MPPRRKEDKSGPELTVGQTLDSDPDHIANMLDAYKPMKRHFIEAFLKFARDIEEDNEVSSVCKGEVKDSTKADCRPFRLHNFILFTKLISPCADLWKTFHDHEHKHKFTKIEREGDTVKPEYNKVTLCDIDDSKMVLMLLF